jgi:hypothetical protein
VSILISNFGSLFLVTSFNMMVQLYDNNLIKSGNTKWIPLSIAFTYTAPDQPISDLKLLEILNTAPSPY